MKRKIISCAVAVLLVAGFSQLAGAQAQKKPGAEQELVRIEMGFFDAWKTGDVEYFRSHIAANGVLWGENGTLSRQQQLEEFQAAIKNCKVEGYGLSDFSVLPLATGSYLLTYKAEQYATCDGEKIPVHLNGSSVYVFKDGRWQAMYRAQIPLKAVR